MKNKVFLTFFQIIDGTMNITTNSNPNMTLQIIVFSPRIGSLRLFSGKNCSDPHIPSRSVLVKFSFITTNFCRVRRTKPMKKGRVQRGESTCHLRKKGTGIIPIHFIMLQLKILINLVGLMSCLLIIWVSEHGISLIRLVRRCAVAVGLFL